MKVMIKRLPPHQNAKVVAILMALASLVFVLPWFLVITLTTPAGMRPPLLMLVLLPLIYLVLSYVMVAVSCAVYNRMYRFIGGLEFESSGR
jgi:hypothetical protein